ncbi:MAG: LemA family protein, partial [Chloroflexia bacterium]
MRSALIVIGVLLVGALLLGGKLVGNRNELVVKREAIDATWAQVDVALQRRADLIPNLVSTVKGYATQEKEIFTNIANARAALTGARTSNEKIA